MPQQLTFQTFGQQAILISWPNEVNEQTSKDIYSFNLKIQKLVPQFIIETVTAYCSLTVYFQFDTDMTELIIILKDLYQANETAIQKPTTWEIPVCYDLLFGIDLENLARLKKLSIQEVINYHTQTLYTVDFLGFLPGFPYLGGLNPILHTPRLTTPRLSVANGSVAIGGKQTGIYPIDSPAGWHVIGRTPLSFFDPTIDQPCFIKPLDKIKFVSIPLHEYNHD